MEQSAIRDQTNREHEAPDFASLHPGYASRQTGQLLTASFPLLPVTAMTSRTRSNTPSASGGQFGDRPSRTMTSRSEGTMITYCPIVPWAKKASRGQPRSIR